jgi:hypothetical protein
VGEALAEISHPWPRSPEGAFRSEAFPEILRPEEGLQDDTFGELMEHRGREPRLIPILGTKVFEPRKIVALTLLIQQFSRHKIGLIFSLDEFPKIA